MLTFFKKKKKTKTPTPPPASNPLRRRISLPLIDTGTQADLSPKILSPEHSLLNHTSTLQDTDVVDNGYSTVRDAIIRIPNHRNSGASKEGDQLRPLPAVPGKGRNNSSSQRSQSDSTFTNLTQDDRSSGSKVVNTRTNGDGKITRDIAAPVYAVVNKERKNGGRSKKGTNNSSFDHQEEGEHANILPEPLTTTPITALTTTPITALTTTPITAGAVVCEVLDQSMTPPDNGNGVVSLPSDVFELSDTEESSEESYFLQELVQDGSEFPRPSSPISVPTHRPPPSPSPKHNPSLSNGTRTSNSDHKRRSSSRENKTSLKSHSSKSTPPSLSSKPPKLSPLVDLPVYSLNQSLTDGYIMCRTDPNGRVEYFTATPILSPSQLSRQSPSPQQHGYSAHMISSTPLKNGINYPAQVHSHNSIPVQPNAQTSIPAHQHIPVPHVPSPRQAPIPVLPHSPIPILPQPTLSLPHPHHISPSQSINVPSSSPLPHYHQLNNHLSSSQPLLNTSYVAGLSEINKVLLEYQYHVDSTVDKHRTCLHEAKHVTLHPNDVVVETNVAMETGGIHQTDSCRKSEEWEMKDKSAGVYDGHEEEVRLMKRENSSLNETISHLSNQIASHQHRAESVTDITADELVTETPLKVKRVLDTLLCENEQKDKQILTLKGELSSFKKLCNELTAKNITLDKSHREVLESTINERQALNASIAKTCDDKKVLKQKLKTSSERLKLAKKDYDHKVEQLKGEIGILRGEIVRFRTNIHRMSCQYQQEESRHVTSCHVTLEDHRLAVAQLEGLLQQIMQESSSTTVQQNIEMSRLKQDNQRLAIELAEVKGRLSIINEESLMLRKQAQEYEGAVCSLNKDLKYSQAREMEALKCLNESLKGDPERSKMDNDITTKMTQLTDKRQLMESQREMELQDMVKKLDNFKTTAKLEKQQLERLCNHDKRSRSRSQHKSKEKICELQSELMKKEQTLEDMQRNKRLAERQRDLLWQSRTTAGIF